MSTPAYATDSMAMDGDCECANLREAKECDAFRRREEKGRAHTNN